VGALVLDTDNGVSKYRNAKTSTYAIVWLAFDASLAVVA